MKNQESPPGAESRNHAGSDSSRERRWEDNAAEFASYALGEGWFYGLLAACSVESGVHPGTGRLPSVPGKVSPNAFARTARTAHETVVRAVAAWDRLAAEGVVPASSALRPVDVTTTPLPDNLRYPWSQYVQRPERDYEAERLRALANRVSPEKIAAALPPEKRAAVVAASVKDPDVVDRVYADRDARIELNRGRFRDQERAAFDVDARIVANGGRVPTEEERHQQVDSPLDRVFQADEAMRRAQESVDRAVAFIREADGLDLEGHLSASHQEQVRQMSLRLLSTLDAEVSR